MRVGDYALLCSAVALVVAGTYRGLRADSPGPARAPERIGVGNSIEPTFGAVRALEGDDRMPGRVRFDAGAPVVGLAAASICPIESGRVELHRAHNVVAVQDDGALRLRGWLDAYPPDGPVALAFALWLDAPDGLEWRTGWARIDPVELAVSGVVVEAPVAAHVDVRVETQDGTPIPGALIAVDDAGLPAAATLQYAFTNESGHVRVSGLAPDKLWRVSLPRGVGPRRGAIERIVSSESETLRVALPGRWEFFSYPIRLPSRGTSLHLEQVERVAREDGTVWATSAWIGSGRGDATRLYLMRRAEDALPGRLRFHFRGFDSLLVSTAESATLSFGMRGGGCSHAR